MKKLRRFLSIMLVFSMLMSMCQIAFAGQTSDPDAAAKAEQAAKQIKSEADSTAIKYYDAVGTVYTGNDRIVKNNSDGQVTVKETITPTGTENLFNIELEVTTKSKVEKKEIGIPAAVTLVIDLSSSMDYCIECGGTTGRWGGHTDSCSYHDNWDNSVKENQTRLYAAKQAAKVFLEKYAQNANAERYVSIVTFGNDSATLKFSGKTWIDVSLGNNLQTVLDIIDELDQASGTQYTNTDSGVKKAQSALKESTVASLEKKFVVMLTDGEPNMVSTTNTNRNNNYSSMKTELNEGLGEGYAVDYTNVTEFRCTGYSSPDFLHSDSNYNFYPYSRPAQRAHYIKTVDKATFYSIGLGLDSYAFNWLTKISSGNNGCVSASDAQTLASAFSTIVEQITNSVKPWTVIVPIDKPVEYVQETNETTEYNSTLRTLTWDLTKDTPVSGESSESQKVYRLTYQVKLNVNDIPDGDIAKYFQTNEAGNTVLNYTLTKTVDDKEQFIDENGDTVSKDKAMRQLTFNVPEVRGYKADLSFNKVALENGKSKYLTGATFDLVCNTEVNGEPIWKSLNNTGNNGHFVFPQGTNTQKMPSGETYTLTEINFPSGYLPIEPMQFAVKYGIVYRGEVAIGTDMDIVDSKETSVTVTKTWVGDDSKERPASIWVALLRNGEKIDSKEITPDSNGNWAGTFEHLYKTDSDGNDYEYSVKEMTGKNGAIVESGNKYSEKYTVAYVDTDNSIINYVQSKDVEITVNKEWVKLADAAPSVNVTLKADGVEVENGTVALVAPNYTHTFSELDKYNAFGTEIEYTVEEDCPDGYTPSPVIKNGNTFTFKNTLNQVKTSVSGEKTWVGTPVETVVQLYADGSAVNDMSKTLNETNGWNYEFTDLDTYNIGTDSASVISYTVKETVNGGAVEDGEVITLNGKKYQVNYFGNNITNTELTDITVNKVWVDAPDFTGMHGQPKVQLTSTSYSTEAQAMVNDSCFFTVPKFNANGEEIEYSVVETDVPAHYTLTKISRDGDIFTITNTYSDTFDITVNKVWRDPNGSSDETATFTLYRTYFDGLGNTVKEQVGQPKTVTSDDANTGRCVFEELDEFYTYVELTPVPASEGEPEPEEPEYIESEPELRAYEYTVEETGFSGNYDSDEPVHNGSTWTFTNTIKPGSTNVIVEKIWDLPEGKSAEATFYVYDGAQIVDTITVSSSQNSGTSRTLPKYRNGEEISYVVVEVPLEGFRTEKNENSFTNTFDDTETDLIVQKIWVDDKTPAERDAVTLELTDNQTKCGNVTFSYENGVKATVQLGSAEPKDAKVTVSEDGSIYTVVLEDMVRYEKAGDDWLKHVYSISETTELTDYNPICSVSADNNTLTVLNKHIAPLVITKKWIDAGDTVRPQIQLTLTGCNADGYEKSYLITVDGETSTMGTLTVDEDKWKITFSGDSQLPEYDENNKKIIYTVEENEDALKGSGYVMYGINGLEVTNGLDPQGNITVKINGEKHWDNLPEDEDFALPENVKVELYAGGREPIETQLVEPDENGSWFFSFEQPRYRFVTNEKGEIIAVTSITYSVEEADVSGGSVMIGADKYAVSYGETGYDITNTYEKTFVYLYKVICNYVHQSWNGETIFTSGEVEMEAGHGEKDEIIEKDPAAYADYNDETYAFDTGKENVTSVKLEEDGVVYVIELNYILTDEALHSPSNPRKPKPTPEEPEVPETPEELEVPETPEEPEVIEVPEDDVPLAEMPDAEEPLDIFEEEVPLADVPATGDNTALWLTCFIFSALALGVLNLLERKDENYYL